jgi:hypothetical protein
VDKVVLDNKVPVTAFYVIGLTATGLLNSTVVNHYLLNKLKFVYFSFDVPNPIDPEQVQLLVTVSEFFDYANELPCLVYCDEAVKQCIEVACKKVIDVSTLSFDDIRALKKNVVYFTSDPDMMRGVDYRAESDLGIALLVA